MSKFFTIPDSYSVEYIETKKCRPLIDNLHQHLMEDIISKELSYNEWTFIDNGYTVAGMSSELARPIIDTFKNKFQRYLEDSKLNCLTGFDSFKRVDICLGCTQYIDNLHLLQDNQVLEHEYIYHRKLKPNIDIVTVDTLIPNKPLIISIPFSDIGKTHPKMNEILDICLEKNIDVHLDGAWITACKNINIDFSHPAIKSFAVSLSKGLGLSGWNRIGLRYTKNPIEDSISIMNDYIQTNIYSVVIGNYFLDNVPVDYLWNKHGDNHYKICKDFDLKATDTIHMATKNNNACGIAPLLRYLENV